MTGLSTATGKAIAAKFPWRDYSSVSTSAAPRAPCRCRSRCATTHLTGGGFDLPAVEPIFEEYVAAHGLADRLRFTAGDFFDDPLPQADVLVMGHILHDWDLDAEAPAAAKAYEALPDGGALIVYEAIIDDDRRAERVRAADEPQHADRDAGGFDYTGADCRGWMTEAGFRDSYVEHLVGPDSMVVGIK